MFPDALAGLPSAADRPVRLRARLDLEVRSTVIRGRQAWNVLDPVSLRYFQLGDEECLVLRLLDGRRSLREIQSQVERKSAPRRLHMTHLHSFLAMLHREGLATAESFGQGEHLRARQAEHQRSQTWAALSNPLAIRFPGVHPGPVLDWLYPKCRWMFSRAFLAACAALVTFAAVVVLIRWEAIRSQLPELRSLFGAGNIFWMAVALATAKGLHELGHALTCRHFKTSCHEVGIMLLVFTPCMYSNVSQAWLIPDKWRRMAVSGAGIAVELVLAALCTLIWSLSEPGILNAICLNMALVCSIGTVLFNGNPLLRFDGYYLLSDWWEVPNLGQRSAAELRRVLARWCAGIDIPGERLQGPAQSRVLLTYAVVSTTYRLALTIGILWFIYALLKPEGLGVVAQLLAVLVVLGMAASPTFQAWTYLRDPARRNEVKWKRLMLVSAFFLGGLAILALIPLPYRVVAPVTVEPEGARRVFVPVAGILQHVVRPGTWVNAGEPLATLGNAALDLEIARLEARCDEQRLLVEHLTRMQTADAKAGEHLPTAQQGLRDLEELLDKRLARRRQLTIVAPRSGMVFPPTSRPTMATSGQTQAPNGSPLDESNRGSSLEVGSLLCIVGESATWEAIAVVEETSIFLVRPGQEVRVQLDTLPDVVFEGNVREIAELDVNEVPPELVASGHIGATSGASGESRIVETLYRARVEFQTRDQRLLFGGTGRAKIFVQPQSLAERFFRVLRQTFSLRM